MSVPRLKRAVGARFMVPACCLLIALISALAAGSAAALSLPPGFQARTLPLPKATSPTWNNGLQRPSTIDFAPDGTMFVAERNGRVVAFDSVEDPTATLVATILDEVHAKGDRGVLGMKLDPGYPGRPFIYLSYTYDAPIGGDSADSTHPHLSDGSDDCDDDCLVSGRLARIEVDPQTDVAVGGPVEPPQEVLVNSWCQQVISHSIGDIEFDSDGALLMSGGDGASWSTADYGQLGNPCEDPPDEGGSLRAQDVRTPGTAADPTDYSGSIIRVDPDTGEAMPDNPFSVAPVFSGEGEDERAGRILAYGLRNPFRFTIQPGTDNVYVGDVGWELWEEIDRVTSPPAPDQQAVNLGWPCFEGGPEGNLIPPRWHAVEKPLCESLYDTPDEVRAPFFAYPHPGTPGFDGHLFEGDACNPSAGSSISGLAFYDPTGVPAEDAFPAEDDGALFFVDASRGCIWTMRAGTDGTPDPATVANFAVHESGDSLFTPVDIVEGPDGALYVPNFYTDSIMQIRYFPGNQAPTADLAVDKTYGAAPLTVKLDASASSDPDAGDHLHYAWDLDGDGEFDDSSQPTVEPTYTEAENVTVKIRVSDDFHHVDVAEVELYPGDLGPPSASIVQPTSDLEWAIGETLEYEATATDPDGDSFDSVAQPLDAHWEFTIQHCPDECHQHPLTSSDSPSGSFVIPPHEYPSHLKLDFTVTDSRGLSDTASVEVFPRLIEVGVDSDPPGIPLTLEGVTSPGPFSATVIAGGSAGVSAPETAVAEGSPLVFHDWSDGGTRVHDVTALESIDLVAHYEPEPTEPGPEGEPALAPPPAPPIEPAAIAMGRLWLASRPAGVPLRIGALRRPAPFAAELPVGAETFLLVPRAIRRHGERLLFARWMSARRRAGTAQRLDLTVGGAPARYLAVYAPE